MPRILVVGGGISGLTIAYRLQQLLPIADIEVWEANQRLGGAVWTETENGFTIEHGPNGFLDNKSSLLNLAHELGLGPRLIPGSEAARKNRFLFVNQRLQQLPGGLGSLFTTPLLSWPGKFRMLAEPLVHRRNSKMESVAAFATRRFGREAAEVFIDPLVTGIHGGDPALLDVRSAFPRLADWEAKFGSVLRGVIQSRRQRKREALQQGSAVTPQRMWSFPNGLREVIEALTGKLNIPPRRDLPVSRIHRSENTWSIHGAEKAPHFCDCVVLACPAPQQAKLIAPFESRLSELIGEIAYNRIAVVALAFRESDVPNRPDGFGFIAPQRTGRDILGAQWCSSIYPNRAPNGLALWRVLCGGWNRPEVVDWPDDQLLRAVRQELQLAQGVVASPVMSKIIRWPQAIPQYLVGHPEKLQAIDRLTAKHPGLFLAGNAYRGIALNDCVENADRVANAVVEYLRAK